MPYIDRESKSSLSFLDARTPGELNYMITKEIIKYVDTRGLSYQTFNDVIGALESAKLEFYRRAVAPYEDIKIKENGDVYTGT